MSRNVLLYTAARLALVVAIATVLVIAGVPAVVAVLIALVVGLALSLVLFRGLRARVATDVAAAVDRRREERDRLRQALRGDDVA